MVPSTPTSQTTLDGQPAILVRSVGWLTLAFLVAFLINNILLLGFGIPSGRELFSDPSIRNLIQPLVYVICFLSIIYWVNKTPNRTLRTYAIQITNFNTYFIRACFFFSLICWSSRCVHCLAPSGKFTASIV